MQIKNAPILKSKEFIEDIVRSAIKKEGNNAGTLLKDVLSSDAQELLKDGLDGKTILNIDKDDLAKLKLKENKTFLEVTKHFFGWNDNWKIGRCILGAIMVHSPEYPTYFLPSYNQSKATGSAGHLKKGEGLRGLLTGALEGIAVGAIVSGAKLKKKEMASFILLGMGLQYLSGKLFPWLGEKMGRSIYLENLKKPPTKPETKIEAITTSDSKPAFKKLMSSSTYPIKPISGNMKV